MLGICLLILAGVVLAIIGLIWFMNRPASIGPTSVAAITDMIFEADCKTYMDQSSGTVAIDQTCKCCGHHRGEKP